jgi:hypothetical protein
MALPRKPDYPNFKKTFRGGVDTVRDPALLEPGDFSMIVNMRPTHPGFETRPGQIKLHSTADGTNGVVSLHQFSKGRITERHLFAQMSDGDVLEATNAPPTVTTGVFGSEVFSGDPDSKPAAWSVIDDKLLFSNGKDQHQIYAGDDNPVDAFIVYKGTGAIPSIPDLGEDYSTEVSDSDSDTYAILNSLSTLSDYDCLFIMTNVRAKSFTFTLPDGYNNDNAAVLAGAYRKSDNTWASLADFVDGTSDGTKAINKSGTITFTLPTDDITKYMFGRCGFWYRFSLSSGSLDASVRVSEVTYAADWQSIENVWDGVPVNIIEAQVYIAAEGTYRTYAASNIDLTDLTTGDIIYFSTYDPIEGYYVDVGETPSTAAVSMTVKGHNGQEFTTVGAIEDASEGVIRSGWVTFARMTVHPVQFNRTQYYAYWYAIEITGTMTDDDSGVYIGLRTMPYFDIDDLGKSICSMTWKGRAVYIFDKWPNTLHISAKNQPMVLNGDDYAILETGDGRLNPITTMRKFHNEFMVWQEERGVEGGTLTLFEGYSPATYGKLCLSSRIGSFNAQSAEICDGVMTSTATDEEIKTLAFFLSHDGVCMSDGKTVRVISDFIQNYFNPKKSECIRRGYESRMWLKYDKGFNILRIGLVSGTTATECNIFPVYDLVDKTWTFDELGQELACMAEIEAASGGSHIIQVGGGTDDGTVYLLNTTNADVAVAIESYAMMELDGKCDVISLEEIILRLKSGSGTATVTVYEDGVAQSYNKSIP